MPLLNIWWNKSLLRSLNLLLGNSVNKRIRKNPDNDRGWNIYFRPDFNNKGEDCNYFTHPRKIELEENVLDYYGE